MLTLLHLLRTQFFLFMFSRLIFGTGQKMIHPFLPEFARGLEVEIAALSWVLSFSYVTSALGPLTGTISDRFGRKTGMLSGLSVLVIGMTSLAFFPSFLTFGIALVGGTLGKIIFMPAFLAHLGDTVPYDKRGFIIGLAEISWALSYIIGVPLAGWVIEFYDWKAPFYFLTVLGILAFLLILWRVRNHTPNNGGQLSIAKNILGVFTNRLAVFGLLIGVTIGSGNEMVRVVLGAWFEDSFQLSVGIIGLSTTTIGFAMLAGELFSAGLMDRLGKPKAITMALWMVMAINLNILWMGDNLITALVWLFLFFMANEVAIVSSLTMVSEIMPETRATMIATFIASVTIGFAIGAPLAPFFYQWGFAATVIASTSFYPLALLFLKRIQSTLRSEPGRPS